MSLGESFHNHRRLTQILSVLHCCNSPCHFNAGHENANIKKKFFKLSEIHADLFDSESESDNDKENKKETSSSSDDEKMETDNKNDEDGSGEQSGDEEEDESTEMSAALKRRLKMVWYSS